MGEFTDTSSGLSVRSMTSSTNCGAVGGGVHVRGVVAPECRRSTKELREGTVAGAVQILIAPS